jgi:hypothetical protein
MERPLLRTARTGTGQLHGHRIRGLFRQLVQRPFLLRMALLAEAELATSESEGQQCDQEGRIFKGSGKLGLSKKRKPKQPLCGFHAVLDFPRLTTFFVFLPKDCHSLPHSAFASE